MITRTIIAFTYFLYRSYQNDYGLLVSFSRIIPLDNFNMSEDV